MFNFRRKTSQSQPEKTLQEIREEKEQELIEASEHLTQCWKEAHLAGSRMKPWITWEDKRVDIVISGKPSKVGE